MSDHLVVMMGRFRAEFPTDRQYARNHMWAKNTGAGHQFGFAAYAVRLLQDVYFLDWTVDSGTQLQERDEMGSIESSKAEASLYSPITGRLAEFNDALLHDPSAINVDKYGDGWLYRIEGEGEGLLGPDEYLQHLEAVWEVTQRTIKGQFNE